MVPPDGPAGEAVAQEAKPEALPAVSAVHSEAPETTEPSPGESAPAAGTVAAAGLSEQAEPSGPAVQGGGGPDTVDAGPPDKEMPSGPPQVAAMPGAELPGAGIGAGFAGPTAGKKRGREEEVAPGEATDGTSTEVLRGQGLADSEVARTGNWLDEVGRLPEARNAGEEPGLEAVDPGPSGQPLEHAVEPAVAPSRAGAATFGAKRPLEESDGGAWAPTGAEGEPGRAPGSGGEEDRPLKRPALGDQAMLGGILGVEEASRGEDTVHQTACLKEGGFEVSF